MTTHLKTNNLFFRNCKQKPVNPLLESTRGPRFPAETPCQPLRARLERATGHSAVKLYGGLLFFA
jgi:hypothetical protein